MYARRYANSAASRVSVSGKEVLLYISRDFQISGKKYWIDSSFGLKIGNLQQTYIFEKWMDS